MIAPGILHWWAGYPAIPLPSTECPASPGGQAQTAGAYVAAGDWMSLFNAAFWATAAIALVAVILTYWTRSMGDRFAVRWRWMMVLSAVVAAVACYFIVSGPTVNTFGCQFGEQKTHVPFVPSLTRASVSLLQAPIWFFVWSFLLTRAVRIGRWQPWFNNSRYPI